MANDANSSPKPGVRFAERRLTAPDGRLESIQILRAVAVLAVALYHSTVLFHDPLAARHAVPDALYFGYAGVDLFFVISGFIIMHVTRKPGLDVAEFALKRVFRILPLYWAVTTLLLVLWLVKPGLVPVRDGNGSVQFMLGSYLLAPMRDRPLLGVGWTLQHEFQFYALMAVLVLAGRRNLAAPVLFALFAIGVVLHVVVDPGLRWWDAKLFSLYSFEFALGIVAYRINTHWRIGHPWVVIGLGAALFVATSIVVTPFMGSDREVRVVAHGLFGLIRTLGFGIGAFLVLLGALNAASTGGAPSRLRGVLGRIGDASFVIYLVHNLVLQGLALITRRFPTGPLVATLDIFAAMALIMVIGLALHRWIERPSIRFAEGVIIPRLLGHRVDTLTIAARKSET